MSRDFNGTSDYLGIATTSPITTTPWTVSMWVKPDTLTAGTFPTFFTVYDNSVTSVIRLLFDVDDADDLNGWLFSSGSYKVNADTGGAGSTGTWVQVAMRYDSATSYSIWKNGGSKVTATDDVSGLSHASLNRFVLGQTGFGGAYFDGKIAHVAVWNGTALSDGQIAELATKSPLLVGSPTAYWPLTNNVSPETDDVGSIDLTVNGATYSTDNPSIQLTNPKGLMLMGVG